MGIAFSADIIGDMIIEGIAELIDMGLAGALSAGEALDIAGEMAAEGGIVIGDGLGEITGGEMSTFIDIIGQNSKETLMEFLKDPKNGFEVGYGQKTVQILKGWVKSMSMEFGESESEIMTKTPEQLAKKFKFYQDNGLGDINKALTKKFGILDQDVSNLVSDTIPSMPKDLQMDGKLSEILSKTTDDAQFQKILKYVKLYADKLKLDENKLWNMTPREIDEQLKNWSEQTGRYDPRFKPPAGGIDLGDVTPPESIAQQQAIQPEFKPKKLPIVAQASSGPVGNTYNPWEAIFTSNDMGPNFTSTAFQTSAMTSPQGQLNQSSSPNLPTSTFTAN
jgi:hypothetical protein